MKSIRMYFMFREARILHGKKGTEVGVMVGLGFAAMRMENMGNLLGYEEWGITSGEEGLDEVGGVNHQSDCRFVTPGGPKRKGCSTWWMKGSSWSNGGNGGV